MKAVIILTEGGIDVGFGHLTRCLALYQAFRDKGIDARIIINGDSSVSDLLSDSEYVITDWIGCQDTTLSCITKDDIVLIDSYLAPLALYQDISQAAGVAAYIDDARRFANYPGGVLINSNLDADVLDYSKSTIKHYLLGPEYHPIRKGFRSGVAKKIRKEVMKILVTFGGSDVTGLTPVVIRHLGSRFPEVDIVVVVGKAFKNIAQIESSKTGRTTLVYHPDEFQVNTLMMDADIVVTAAGQTLFELAAIGTPTVAVSIFRKHRDFAIDWEKAGFIEYAGFAGEENLLSNLDRCLDRLLTYAKRRKRNVIGRSMVDGQGAVRVADFLLAIQDAEPELSSEE